MLEDVYPKLCASCASALSARSVVDRSATPFPTPGLRWMEVPLYENERLSPYQ